MAHAIISLAEAKAQGLKRFYTGLPCINGHIAERYVSVKKCVACQQLAVRLDTVRKAQAEGTHTAEDIARIYRAQRGRCAYCRQEVGKDFDVDHIQPLSKGGTNWPANLQITCHLCNRKKKARDPLEFARSLGLLL